MTFNLGTSLVHNSFIINYFRHTNLLLFFSFRQNAVMKIWVNRSGNLAQSVLMCTVLYWLLLIMVLHIIETFYSYEWSLISHPADYEGEMESKHTKSLKLSRVRKPRTFCKPVSVRGLGICKVLAMDWKVNVIQVKSLLICLFFKISNTWIKIIWFSTHCKLYEK